MKMWKENKVCNEWELSNTEIAERFLKSEDYTKHNPYGGIAIALVDFIASKDGLNSIWEWDEKKGSIDGSKDILEILSIIRSQQK